MSSPSDKKRNWWHWLDALLIPAVCFVAAISIVGACVPKAKAGDQEEAAAAFMG